MENNSDYYLSDWMADKISDEQLREKVSTEDFLAYQKIRNVLENYTIASPKIEDSFSAVQEKISQKQSTPKTKVVQLWKYGMVAASLLLFFGWYQTFYFSNQIVSNFGATKTITLKDRSIVTINAKTTLKYPNQFLWNRTLQLDGEAFFEVEKGSTFTVETTFGTVQVLGTKFNVISDNNFFEVQCYEGKVRVLINGVATELTKNKSLQLSEGKVVFKEIMVKSKPSWINLESSFVNVPFEVVINKFYKQFQKKIIYPNQFKNIKFSGNFSNTNYEIAIKSITIPMQLKYSIQRNTIILSE